MPPAFHRVIVFGILILPLSFSLAAFAQQPGGGPSAPPAPTNTPDDFNEPGMDRQEIREEMQKIRVEHEDLEAQHDQLKTQCMNAKGQDHTTCREQWEALHQKTDALHERMKALHEKMEALRQEHPDRHDDPHHAMNNRDQPLPDNDGPAGGPSPSIPANTH